MGLIEEIREKGIKKYVAAVLFGIIILVFVFMGTGAESPMGPGYAARVNNKIVSVREYQAAIEQMVAFYSQMFGGQFDAEMQERMRIRESALEQLISREATSQAAVKSGFLVTDAEVRDLILSVPVFQQDGKFRREYYDNFLLNRRTSAAQFEADIKKDIISNRTREAFQNALRPTSLELDKLVEFGKEKVNLEFLRFDTARLSAGVKVSNDEAGRFLAVPENEARVRDYFNVNKSQYEKQERVKARHILAKVDPSQPTSETAALEKIKKAQEMLKTKSFEQVAKEMTEDLGSQAQGGDLGFFERGRMVKPFEDAAFSAEIGKVTEPVKSDFGYHLIKVEAREGGTGADFEKHKVDAAKALLAQEKADKILEEIKGALASGNSSAINTLAAQLGVKWEETGVFALTDDAVPKIGDGDAVFSAALRLTPQNSLAKELVSGTGAQYAIRLKSRVKSEVKEDQLRKEHLDKISGARTRDAYSKWTDNIVKSSRIEKNELLLNSLSN